MLEIAATAPIKDSGSIRASTTHCTPPFGIYRAAAGGFNPARARTN